MRTIRQVFCSVLILSGAVLFSCESESAEDSATKAEDQPLRELPVAVEDPAQEERVMDDFSPKELTRSGLPVEMQLPEGVVVKQSNEVDGWLILNEDESFKLVVVPDDTDIMDLAVFWKGNPDNYIFRKMILQTPQGIMFEAERNNLVEYHMDFVSRGAESLRFYNAKDKPFSQYEIERMFHACRTIQPKMEGS